LIHFYKSRLSWSSPLVLELVLEDRRAQEEDRQMAIPGHCPHPVLALLGHRPPYHEDRRE